MRKNCSSSLSPGLIVTDLRLQNRIGQDDQEALEHIARALEGRVLPDPSAAGVNVEANGNTKNGAPLADATGRHGALPPLDPTGVETLIEAMPAAIGILKDDALTTANNAFAYAFGYRAPAELIASGGLDAILPGGVTALLTHAPNERISDIAALSRSRRRLSVTFILTPLDGDARLRLLRLVDPADIDPSGLEIEPPAPIPPTAEAPIAETPKAEASAPAAPGNAADRATNSESAAPDRPLFAVPAVTPVPDPRPEIAPHASVVEVRDAEAEVPPDRPPVAADTSGQHSKPLDKPEANDNTATEEAPPMQAPDEGARQLDFLAKVSHEVRTPLNSIIGFAELMLHERFGPIGNARYKGYAEDIHQSGLYALSLLNDLLDISKIEAGKFELDFTSVDVAEVVEACVTSLQPLAKRTRIVLRTSFADDLPVVVADPRRLRQILLNLLTNSIKFTPEGGQVIVSGTIVGGDLRLRVHDTGVGMSESDIAYAMQPFHQLDTSPRHQSGTGLGLPLTKALTDAIRAQFDLTSEPGVGTSADVIFPKERLFRS